MFQASQESRKSSLSGSSSSGTVQRQLSDSSTASKKSTGSRMTKSNVSREYTHFVGYIWNML